MKIQLCLIAATALSLSACGKPPATGDASPKAEKPAEQAAAKAAPGTPAPVASATAFSKEFMIGKWAEVKDGDCTLAQEFRADGTVDGIFDSWSVEGSTMHVKLMGEPEEFTVKVIDPKHVEIQAAGAKPGYLVRC